MQIWKVKIVLELYHNLVYNSNLNDTLIKFKKKN